MCRSKQLHSFPERLIDWSSEERANSTKREVLQPVEHLPSISPDSGVPLVHVVISLYPCPTSIHPNSSMTLHPLAARIHTLVNVTTCPLINKPSCNAAF